MVKRHRRSKRLPNYDYSQPGWYFITICTFHQLDLFGNVKNRVILLNDLGKIAKTAWLETAEIRDNVELDEYIIMPNHMHGIIHIVNNNVGAHRDVPLPVPRQTEQFGKSTKNSIPTIIKLFKSTVTKQINQHRKIPGFPVWQRNYYKHIIRNVR